MNRLACPRVLTVLALAGCTEEVKRFDAEVQVTRAVDVGDGALQYSYVDNLGIGDGSGVARVQGLRVGIDATSIQFTVETVGGQLPGLGRSAFLPIVDDQTLDVHVLVAPLDAVRKISDAPSDLGGNACVAADGEGNIFLVGGTSANEAGYVYDSSFVVRSFGPGVLKGIGGLGCGAFQGAVAAVGGCTDELREVQLIQADGTVTTFPTSLDDACGATAAPAANEGVWVVDGDGTVTLRDADNTEQFTRELGAAPRALEVTAEGNLVVLSGTSAFHVNRNAVTQLSPATALGRRGSDVFILDDGDIKRVVEAEAPKRLRGGVAAVDHFAVQSDDTVVGLRGTTVSIFAVDGSTSTLTAPRQHSTLVALPGDTIVLAGATGDGFDGFSRR